MKELGMTKIKGINHIVLATSDMARTIEFYRDTLGLPVKSTVGISASDQGTAQIPGMLAPTGTDWKRFYFFELGDGLLLGFLEFPDRDIRPEPSYFDMIWPNDQGLRPIPQKLDHLAFDVEDLGELHELKVRLEAKGYEVSPVQALESTPFLKSIYTYDPNGLPIEFATWDRNDPKWQARTPEMFYTDPEPIKGAGLMA
jgi:catechol 2,3-dioxygenase-like lactoylglutathione lyase family enzyme